MSELEQYLSLASAEHDTNNGKDLVLAMEAVSRAIVRVGALLAEAEHTLLLKVRNVREGLVQYEFSEARLREEIRIDTVEEQATVGVLKALLTGLNGRFKSLQSALSYLKSEMRL